MRLLVVDPEDPVPPLPVSQWLFHPQKQRAALLMLLEKITELAATEPPESDFTASVYSPGESGPTAPWGGC